VTLAWTLGHVSIGTMHLAKGLEFRAVVMACDDEVIPLQERIERVGDDADLQELYDTERHLLFVACTRARDHLLVTGVAPVSNAGLRWRNRVDRRHGAWRARRHPARSSEPMSKRHKELRGIPMPVTVGLCDLDQPLNLVWRQVFAATIFAIRQSCWRNCSVFSIQLA
jgi:ATP-dependent exoDNAse (exonuclease V) beta subunit